MPGWRLRRRLAAARRAAVAASFDDPRFDPNAVLAAAASELASALGRRMASEAEPVKRLFEIETTFHMPSQPEIVPPEKVHVSVDRPGLWIESLERAPDMAVVEVVVRAEARARVWAGGPSYWLAIDAGRQRALASDWSFVPADGGWRLDDVRDARWVDLGLRDDPSGQRRRVRRLRDESMIELAEPPVGRNIPFDIATNLPEAPENAMRELAMVDGRFEWGVIEASVRRIHERLEHPSRERLVGVRVKRVRALRTPPELHVELRLRVSGRLGAARHSNAWWRMAARDSPAEPWHLAAVEGPFDA